MKNRLPPRTSGLTPSPQNAADFQPVGLSPLDERVLLAFALRSPAKARWCWSRLMDTDGLRGDVHPQTKEWTWGYLRLDTRRVLSTLHRFASPETFNPERN